MYKYDKEQNLRFLTTNRDMIDSFFTTDYKNSEDDAPLCLSKYIFSDTLDCAKEGFINYDNQLGIIPIRRKR